MTDVRIMIVDDSPFTVAVMREFLERHGFNVVGSASTMDEVVDSIVSLSPDLVTMDMTLPGTDGFECTRMIHAFDPDVKVIAVSAMKDDEIVGEALRNNISAYVQKPINEKEFIDTIRRVMFSGNLFDAFCEEFFPVFKDAFIDAMLKMTKTGVKFGEDTIADGEYSSAGTAVSVGIVGGFSGRMILSMSNAGAAGMAVSILKREPKDEEELSALLTELANIISGNAGSALNKRDASYGLRLTSPSVLPGKQLITCPSDFLSYVVKAETVFGEMVLDVGFMKK